MAQKAKEIGQMPPSVSAETLKAELVLLRRQLEYIVANADLNSNAAKNEKLKRTSGRFKGALAVGAEFFEPLSENELKEFEAE